MSARVSGSTSAPLLRVEGLRVQLCSGPDVVSDVEFAINTGEIIGIVGESGSGKTTIAAALLGHVRAGARIAAGQVWFDGVVDILSLSRADLRRIRGRVVSYVSQDPATALNPVLRLGAQLEEVLVVHEPALSSAERKRRVKRALSDVGLPDDDEFSTRFAHQLSGGQQQRVLLALAFLPNPRLIVLDEPTTALDVSTQAKVLETLRNLCSRHQTAAVYISHDLATVRNLVDRVLVLYAGKLAESAASGVIFTSPAHPYTRGLLDATPSAVRARHLRPIAGEPASPGSRPSGCAFAPRCAKRTAVCSASEPPLRELSAGQTIACFNPLTTEDVPTQSHRGWVTEQPLTDTPPLMVARRLRAGYGAQQVLFDVDLELHAGECLALVGESGSGKTTLARALAGLAEQATGELTFAQRPLAFAAAKRDAITRRGLQYVFQNPYRALNPTKSVRQILTEALRHFFPVTAVEAEERVANVLERVALRRECIDDYPRELSGGERQRIAIARALLCEPRVLICDEVTSSLDVSVQASILKLLRSLQDDGLSLLFVTHDLGVVRTIADRVMVLHQGRVVETGSVSNVLLRPSAAYTRELVQHSPGQAS
jgi:peptide/nickel transport system ATP-binding protein